ncbi:hypothetical protein RJ639_038802 [Escallonia herrerae]|uniref:Reverse transcriptase Ty1/copia-type domain-containing protein n=1 Tax=Escallonia herrerae TaxID=1293975 RepID=A0AA89BFU0_9ASTE|nr:hypothetical protein RJ639_038802 [Escallonia herrerae]
MLRFSCGGLHLPKMNKLSSPAGLSHVADLKEHLQASATKTNNSDFDGKELAKDGGSDGEGGPLETQQKQIRRVARVGDEEEDVVVLIDVEELDDVGMAKEEVEELGLDVEANSVCGDIKERFLVVNGPRIQQLKTELANCKQKGLTIVNYYGKVKMIWDELTNFEHMPTCKCGKCTCDLGSVLEKKREEEKVHQLLMGLDETIYGTVRSNLLAQDPLSNLNRVYSTLIQEERVKTIAREKEERVRELFRTRWLPEWWGDRPHGDGKAGGRGRGQQQQKIGHSRSRGRGGTSRANAVQTAGEGPFVSTANAIDTESSGTPGLSTEQWQTLLAMLKSQKPNASKKMIGKHNLWIIDIGALNHMTGNAKNLRDVREISICPVALPDGNNAVPIKESSIVLGRNLILKDGLYVPGLICNLISVSQLIDHSDCFVQFTISLCVIQGRTLRMLIGAGERGWTLLFPGHTEHKGNESEGFMLPRSLAQAFGTSFSASDQTEFPYPILDRGITNDIMGQSLLDYVVDEEFQIDGDLEQPVSSAEQNVADPVAQEVRPDNEGNMEEQFGHGHCRKQASVRLHDYAMQREIQALENNKTWEIEDLPPGVVQVNVLVYVDDLIISRNNHAAIQRFKTYLSECFHMKDLGALKYFLGVEVARGPEGIFLCQRKYALDITSEVGLLGAKLASVPLEQNHQLALATGPLINDPECYRRLVGRLIYLCFTRPELSYCVHVLSQFMQQLRKEHWEAALRVVHYLKGNLGQGILLSNECNLRLHGWCDAD